MKNAIADVAAFHEACDVPIKERPEWPLMDRGLLRMRLLREEFDELNQAFFRGRLEDVADGIADLIYVAIGTALEFGIPLDAVWAEVQRSNMAKADPVIGQVRRREDGKVLKPEGWTPPNVAGVLASYANGDRK